MTAPHADQIIDGYLSRLNAEAADLPKPRREELLQDVREHLAEARSNLPSETDADILNILDRLGEPAELVQEARDRFGIQRPRPFKPGLAEIGALVLLPIFWVVGVILLWASPAWTTRDKLIGTFLPPGGFAGLFTIGLIGTMAVGGYGCGGTYDPSGHPIQYSCTASPPPDWWQAIGPIIFLLLLAAFAVLPVLTSIYLANRLRRANGSPVTGGFASASPAKGVEL